MTKVEPTLIEQTVSEATAQRSVKAYLTTILGPEYRPTNGFYGQAHWYFLIQCHCAALKRPWGVGKITVDATTGEVIALDAEQIRDIREASAMQIAQAQGCIARDERGYLLRREAAANATQWLGENLTMHFSASDGLLLFLGGRSPDVVWRFSIRFRLPATGEIKPPGVIEVDAVAGKVTPLNHQQIQTIQEHVCALVQHRELAPATRG